MPLRPARPKLWQARPKLWPARPKLWPAQRGKHSIKLTYDPRLSDKSGGPAPPCIKSTYDPRLSDNSGGPAPSCDGRARGYSHSALRLASPRLAALCMEVDFLVRYTLDLGNVSIVSLDIGKCCNVFATRHECVVSHAEIGKH